MTACVAGCDHTTPHGICRRHGEARHYVLGSRSERRCDCPPTIIQTDSTEAAEWAHRVLTDTPNGDTWPVLEEVAAERARQDAKRGEQNHPDGTGGAHREHLAVMDRWACQLAAQHFTVSWRLILQEEVSEAFAETDPARLRTELIQIAAVACQWAQAIDRRGRGAA